MMINRLPWYKKLRTSAANNLDKINEVIDYINHSDISEVALSENGSGRNVQAGKASSLKDLIVNGESIQDGTPTPDNPIDVQIVEGRNLFPFPYEFQDTTVNGITFTINLDGSITITGTATANVSNNINLVTNLELNGTYTISTGRNDLPEGFTIRWGASVSARVRNSPVTVNFNNSYNFYIIILDGTVMNHTIYPQLEAGSTATPYVPYGCIGLKIGDTVTPIDLQGNVLASLPDGTKDELKIDSAGHVTIEKNTLYYTIDSNTLTLTSNNAYTPIISDMQQQTWGYGYCNSMLTTRGQSSDLRCKIGADNSRIYIQNATPNLGSDIDEVKAWFAANYTYIYSKLATPTIIDLGYIEPPTIENNDFISIIATITPEINASWWSYDDITELITNIKDYVDYKTSSESDTLGLHVIQPINIRDDLPIMNEDLTSLDESVNENDIESEE